MLHFGKSYKGGKSDLHTPESVLRAKKRPGAVFSPGPPIMTGFGLFLAQSSDDGQLLHHAV